jgi:hypothetical protein
MRDKVGLELQGASVPKINTVKLGCDRESRLCSVTSALLHGILIVQSQ